MKIKIAILLFLFSNNCIKAQPLYNGDSLKVIINLHKGDTAEVGALFYFANQLAESDSVIKYAREGLSLAKKLNYRKREADCLFVLSDKSGSHAQAIQYAFNALNIYESLQDHVGIASARLLLQGNYRDAGDYGNALLHAFAGLKLAEADSSVRVFFWFPGHSFAPLFLAEIAQSYVLRNQLDSALSYTQSAISVNELFNGAKWNFLFYLLATIQNRQGKYKSALENYRLALPLAIRNNFARDTFQILSGISTLYINVGNLDSAIFYGKIVADTWNDSSESKNLLEVLNNLAQGYKSKGYKDSALKYTEQSYALKDSIFSSQKDKELQNITFNEQLKQLEILSSQAAFKTKVQLYAAIAGALVLLLLVGISWRNNLQRKKSYIQLEKQKQETDIQKMKVEQAFEELKSTQAQLVQREKMASLGELMAGIAHEIQNPLNFVNNFSEVSVELAGELKEELDKLEMPPATKANLESIADDLVKNQEKINHHGKRADAIVKGMLQHSRSTTGQKEPTDINALTDEYLRLSYHGLRAKDKSFNATMNTDYDQSIGEINIISQEIGRVLLNLFTNAFYSVNEKSSFAKASTSATTSADEYEPAIWVTTKKADTPPGGGARGIEIRVRDNGMGIPQKILDKIYQPFFTTKPVGQGTGLGLSLSYDTIVKVHGGQMHVETKEGEFAEFIISLPL